MKFTDMTGKKEKVAIIGELTLSLDKEGLRVTYEDVTFLLYSIPVLFDVTSVL